MFFQLFRCRNLALIRVFSYFSGRHVLYLGVSGCPHICTPPYICMPPGVYMPPYAPYSSMPLCVFWRLCMLWALVMGCWDTFPYITPVWGCLPFNCTAHTQSLVPCASVCFRDISMLCGHFPSVRKGLGCFPHQLGVGASALEMSICSFMYLFVLHYVSCFNCISDYYSSSYSGIFWPVFCVISDSGSFPDRVSSKV